MEKRQNFNTNFDIQVKEAAEKEALELPEGYEDRLRTVLSQLEGGTKHKAFRFTWKATAAAAACAVLLCSMPVAAAVNYFKERMEALTEEEKNTYLDELTASQEEADQFSREFTQDENRRIQELRTAYMEQGKFPEQELALIEEAPQAQVEQVLYLPSAGMFYLPERELMDEEILQIVDYWCKRDYSLENSWKDKWKEDAQQPLEDPEEETQDGLVNKEEAVAFIKNYILETYGVDTQSFQSTVKLDDIAQEGEEPWIWYDITIYNPDTEVAFYATMDASKIGLGSFSSNQDLVALEAEHLRNKGSEAEPSGE